MIDRNIIRYGFGSKEFPEFTCPKCHKGQLAPESVPNEHYPQFSKDIQKEEWADSDHIELQLALVLECANPKCGQRSIAYAKGGVQPSYGLDGETEWFETFKLKQIFPAPFIIDLPSNLPFEIELELEKSFNVFWVDKGLCANAIRNAIELMLDHFGFPKEVDGKWISLGNRLIAYSKSAPDHADFLKLLKPIINAGSHGDAVETGVLLDIYEAMEIFLDKVFSQRTARFEELKKLIKEKSQ